MPPTTRAARAPQDRQTKTTTRRRATSTDPTPAEVAQAEVDREAPVGSAADDAHRVPVHLGDLELNALPPGRWRGAANSALREGRFSDLAALILDEDGYAAWLQADPMNDEVRDFISELLGASGYAMPGGTSPLPPSSSGTRRI